MHFKIGTVPLKLTRLTHLTIYIMLFVPGHIFQWMLHFCHSLFVSVPIARCWINQCPCQYSQLNNMTRSVADKPKMHFQNTERKHGPQYYTTRITLCLAGFNGYSLKLVQDFQSCINCCIRNLSQSCPELMCRQQLVSQLVHKTPKLTSTLRRQR